MSHYIHLPFYENYISYKYDNITEQNYKIYHLYLNLKKIISENKQIDGIDLDLLVDIVAFMRIKNVESYSKIVNVKPNVKTFVKNFWA